jgi:hypothetical protein
VGVAVLCAAVVALGAWAQTQPGATGSVVAEGGAYALTNAGFGALLVHLRPRNAIGWLLVLTGVLQGLSAGLTAYGGYGVDVAQPAWPLASWAAQLSSVLWFPSILIPATLLVAVYPSGRLAGGGGGGRSARSPAD